MSKESIQQFEAALPRHECSLMITHNQHKVYYQPIEDYIKTNDFTWSSEEAKAKSIATNEIWEMTWYPDTPVGSYDICAPTLFELLEFSAQLNQP